MARIRPSAGRTERPPPGVRHHQLLDARPVAERQPGNLPLDRVSALPGPMPANHVPTVPVRWTVSGKDSVITPSGEIRPRMRSPKVRAVRPVAPAFPAANGLAFVLGNPRYPIFPRRSEFLAALCFIRRYRAYVNGSTGWTPSRNFDKQYQLLFSCSRRDAAFWYPCSGTKEPAKAMASPVRPMAARFSAAAYMA